MSPPPTGVRVVTCAPGHGAEARQPFTGDLAQTTALPPGAADYDFKRDATFTPRGNEGYASYDDRLEREACRKDWTVLVYMAADVGDLAPFALWNIHDMETPLEGGGSATSGPRADVLVQLDLDEPKGVRRIHVVPDSDAPDAGLRLSAADFDARGPARIRSPIAWYAEDEERSPSRSLEAFLDWGLTHYPSEHVMVVLWGHGAGWRGRSSDEAMRRACPAKPDGSADFIRDGGIGPDCSAGTVLDIPALADTLRAAARRHRDGRPIDVLANDACLMQSVEVTAELIDAARYIVGYEQIAPHAGLPYRALLPWLNGARAPTPDDACDPKHAPACEVAALIPRVYEQAVDEGFFTERRRDEHEAPVAETYTISAVDADALDRALVPALADLARALSAALQENPLLGVGLSIMFDPPSRPPFDAGSLPAFLGGPRDLGVLLTAIEAQVDFVKTDPTAPAEAALREAITRARAATDAAILRRAEGSRYDPPDYPAGLAGLTIWLPRDEAEFRERSPDFTSARFYERARIGDGGGWEGWIAEAFAPPP